MLTFLHELIKLSLFYNKHFVISKRENKNVSFLHCTFKPQNFFIDCTCHLQVYLIASVEKNKKSKKSNKKS
jgi:hypothetical protein